MDYAVMTTSSKLLESTLPAPNISTSPSGLNQAEQPRQSHPETLQAFDVAPAVQTFIDGLLATPERFKPVDYRRLSLAAREAAVDKIWDSAVVESANSLVNFSLYFEGDDGQAGVSAQWHAQGSNTQTHSDVAAQASAHALAQHRLEDDANSENLLKTDDGSSHARGVAQEIAEQESRAKHSWTFDYLLKADASSDRCLSIVEVKRL
ncbi:hypothetical protein ABBQ32_010118 [Trebouxia sp. C0010 RCD-2024]